MTHLRIELNTTPEIVTSDVIHKLYETAKAIIDAEEANDVQESLVSLKGNLLVSKAYGDEIDWLETKFPDLHITAGARYIRFQDSAVYARLSLYLGDGTGITSSEITNANIFSSSNDSSTGYPYFQNNTSITSFNELGLLPQVTTIPNNAFYGASSLTSIDLSNITSLGTQTFMGCASLTSVDLSNVTGIGNGGCFTNCTSLASVTFPNIPFSWATNINEQGFLFTGCTALTQADISNATTVGKAWFRNCYALTEVDWPATVTTIPQEAFYDCYNLESLGSKIIPVSIGSWAFYHCRKITSDDIDFSNCKYIGGSAFNSCTGLTSVDLSSLTQIDDRAFKGCTGITSVDLSSCTTFGSKPFEECTNLTTITLSNSLTTLPAYALFGCTGLTTINGGSNIASYREGALENCSSLTSLDLSSCTSIGSNAFKNCTSLGTGLTLELNLTGLTSYPNDAFYNTKYSRLILHSPLLTSKYDPRYPLYELMSNLTYLDLSDFLVGTDAFDNTNTKYYEGSFYGNTSLVTFIYPLNVNSLKANLKYGRTVSTYRYAIILNTTPPSLDISDSNNPPSGWFTNSNLHIYVPDSAKAAYLADSDWASIGGNNGSVTISDRLHGLSELPAGVWTTGLASQYLTPAQLATS